MGGAVNNIPNARSIESPEQLSEVLKEINQAVAAGYLHQVEAETLSFANDFLLSDILIKGPWPDYFELYFQESNFGQRYKLSVETYHGAGGCWDRENI